MHHFIVSRTFRVFDDPKQIFISSLILEGSRVRTGRNSNLKWVCLLLVSLRTDIWIKFSHNELIWSFGLRSEKLMNYLV